MQRTAPLTLLDITKFFAERSGGIRTYLLAKGEYVRRTAGLRQVLLTPADVSTREQDGSVTWYRVRGPRIPTQAPYRFLLDHRAVLEIVERERPDVIEVGSPYVVPWIGRHAARRLGIPLVWFFHTDFPRTIAPRGRASGAARWLLARAAQRYVRGLGGIFDAVVAASDLACADLRAAGVPDPVKIPLGVDLRLFTPARRARAAETRTALKLPDGPLVLFVGRLAREKNLGLVLEAWPRIEARTDAHLVLVGDGPSRRHFQAAARARRIHWLPYCPDRGQLADLIAAADLLLSPGPNETFGLSALEALASGTPVICVEAAVAEMVRASGAGAVVDDRDAEDLAARCVELLQSDLAPLRARARAYTEQHHSWDIVFERLFTLYRSLALRAVTWEPARRGFTSPPAVARWLRA